MPSEQPVRAAVSRNRAGHRRGGVPGDLGQRVNTAAGSSECGTAKREAEHSGTARAVKATLLSSRAARHNKVPQGGRGGEARQADGAGALRPPTFTSRETLR